MAIDVDVIENRVSCWFLDGRWSFSLNFGGQETIDEFLEQRVAAALHFGEKIPYPPAHEL